MKKYNLFDPTLFTQYRSALMGVSIILIFLFHSGNVGIPIYDHIRKFGWVGVDIFIFLSALGLSFSLENNNSSIAFYNRRAKRILPTWLIVLLCVHFLGSLCNTFLPSLPFDAPHTILQCFCWYTGLGFYISDFVSEPRCFYYEWYVPSLMFFYAISPFIYKQKTKCLVAFLISAFVISYLLASFRLLYSLHWFYLRFPIFITGFLFYRMIKSKYRFYPHVLCFSLFLGLIGCELVYGLGVKDIQKLVFQLLVPQFCIVFIFIIKILRLSLIFSFFGGISLELYLVHIYNRPQYLVGLVFDNKLLIVIATLVTCSIMAICLQLVTKFITKKLKI